MNYGWILSKYICIKFLKNKNLTFKKKMDEEVEVEDEEEAQSCEL